MQEKRKKSFFFFPSDIFCSAIRAQPFAAKWLAAVATDVACTVVAEVAPEGKDDIGKEQRIAHIVEGEHAKHYIVNGAYCSKAEKIKDRLTSL